MLPRYAVHHRVVVGFCVFLILAGGLWSYFRMGRLEDPVFTVKTAVVATLYPGASAETVANQVTNVVERAAQQIEGFEKVRSISRPGMSIVLVDLLPTVKKEDLPDIWQELRNKVQLERVHLPPECLPPIVKDDFGEVYGIVFALSCDGFPAGELRDRARDLQKEFLRVDQVRRVELWGLPEEQIEVEISQARMTDLNIHPLAVFLALAAQNATGSSGDINLEGEKIRVAPSGAFQSLEEIGDLVIPDGIDISRALGSIAGGSSLVKTAAQFLPLPSGQGGTRQIRLRDIAEIRRVTAEEPSKLMRSNGRQAVAIALSPIPNGDVILMGKMVRQRAEELMRDYPAGYRLDTVSYQPDNVNVSIHAFTENLYEAIIIVTFVVLVAMGWRSGILITSSLLIVMLGTVCILKPMGIVLQRVSLGAFIIALGILVDDAVVVGDLILVRMQRGMERTQACIEGANRAAFQLLGATIVGALAFLPIWLSPDMTGEYAGGLFTVLAISLMISWVVAMTQTPVAYYMLVYTKPMEQNKDPHGGPVYRAYRRVLEGCLHHKTAVLSVLIAALIVACYGFTKIPRIFFPRASRTQFMVDYWLPEGSSINAVAADLEGIEKYLMQQDGVVNVAAFMGGGPPRFYLPYEPELPNSSYGHIVVNVRSLEDVDRLLDPVEDWIQEHYPQAQSRAQRFALGPTTKEEVEFRFSGPDEEVLHRLANQAKDILRREPGAKFIWDDWRQKIPTWSPEFSQTKGARAQLTRLQMQSALLWATRGIPAATYQEGENYLKVVVRSPRGEVRGTDKLKSTPVWGLSTEPVALEQIIDSAPIVWENGEIMRRNRFSTITVGADADQIGWGELIKRVRPAIESIELPPGYRMEIGGQYEKSKLAEGRMMSKLPPVLVMMAVIVVILFNRLRQPLIILLTFPLAMIGITFGMIVMRESFGFMALVGAMSLLGMMVRNGVVLMDQIDEELAKGEDPYHAIVDASVERMRPVTVAAMTVIVGMIPLLLDPLFSSMATAIMFGLIFATVLTLFVVPIFYMILFRVKLPAASGGSAIAVGRTDAIG
ncbi:MAG: efflux RND transporter permease subunit [Thermoguttaceae bacterium]|nr:efflux RND transporter permease subunit [Thermoguttaceae bacterium]